MAGAAIGKLPVASLNGGRCGVLPNACPLFLFRHSAKSGGDLSKPGSAGVATVVKCIRGDAAGSKLKRVCAAGGRQGRRRATAGRRVFKGAHRFILLAICTWRFNPRQDQGGLR